MRTVGFAGKALRVACSFAMASTMMVLAPLSEALAADDINHITRITDLNTLKKFRDDVASGNTYEGVTVTLASNLSMSSVESWTPIGTKESPFCGTFDGANRHIDDLNIDVADEGTSYVGLFGYIGPGGAVKNLSLEDCTVTVSASDRVIKNVGSIAGYVYGAIGDGEYALENCSSDAKVSVVSKMVINEEKILKGQAPDAAIENGYSDEGRVMEFIGGLAGYCAGSVNGCSYSGSLYVRTDQLPDPNTTTMALGVGGIVGQVGGYVIAHELDGDMMNYEPVYPTADGKGSNYAAASKVVGCKNEGTVTTVINADAGKDRFDREVTAKLSAVGGIAGYALTSFSMCTNEGAIEAPTGDGTGGIVGVLRGITFSGSTYAAADPGMFKPADADESQRLNGPELLVFRCTNDADVVALHAGGGIAGGSGTYCTFNQCANLKNGNIHGCRWNKPMMGGIVGQTYSSVTYCYNRATVSSDSAVTDEKGNYVVKDNGNRQFKTGGATGYYCAGLVGSCYRFIKDEGSAESTSPTPEISACYTTGDVLANGSYNQAGICGESEGTIYSCYFLADSVSYTGDAVANNLGTINFDTVVGLDDEGSTTASDLLKSKAYTAKLNATALVDDYSSGNCFVPAASSKENNGYSVLAWQSTATPQTIDESKLSYEGVGSARYSASANPIPELKVSYDGSALVEGADFYAVPDESVLDSSGQCKDVADVKGQTFSAHIVGMGQYASEGETAWSAPYTLAKGDFATCVVQITATVYNFYPQYPAEPSDADDSQVVIYDAAGKRVAVSEYTMAADPGTYVDYHETLGKDAYDKKKHVGYQIEFTATEQSNYEGKAYGFFIIRQAALINSDKARITAVTWNGQTWQYSMSGVYGGGQSDSHLYRVDENGNEVPGMAIPYTGESIKPEIEAFMYKDRDGVEHELEKNIDYRVVYGDPGTSDNLIARDPADANVNVSTDEIGNRACFTFRFVALNSVKRYNFSNYEYVFFDIVPADLSKEDQATVMVSDEINMAEGLPKVTVVGATGVTLDSSNYTVKVEIVSSDSAKVTVSGVNNCTGEYTKIVKATNIPSIAGGTIAIPSASYAYTGSAITPAATVKVGGKTLAAGTDYVVSYSGNNAIGTATVTVEGKGEYTGKLSKTFTINPAKVTLSKVAKGKKKFTATWKTVSGSVGYQVRYSLKKSMASSKMVSAKGKKLTVKAKGGKTYYVQVRAFKKVAGKTYYGAWSAKKSVKTKK